MCGWKLIASGGLIALYGVFGIPLVRELAPHRGYSGERLVWGLVGTFVLLLGVHVLKREQASK